MGAPERLARFKALVAQLREAMALGFGFVLWDGSRVPADWPADGLAIAIADENVVAALARRRSVDTLLNLWVAGRIDIRNGTIFDIVARRPKVRTKEVLRSLNKGRAIQALAPFLFLGRGSPWPLERVGRGAQDGSAESNKANIGYHYDVSNAFYRLFLDPELVYSCAYFTDWSNDLATAQRDKLEMICRKLRLKPGERFLDIGCGWGALVCHAALHHGVTAHGVTLSEEQFAGARAKVAALGLQDRVTIELKDYKALEGSFDKIASIGMFEHVGIDHYPAYFRQMNRLLVAGGLYLHHCIARPAKRNDRVFRRKRPEFAALTRYIFPGGELDHLGMSVANLERHGFEVRDVEGWREHYARTCRLWHDNLLANRDAAEKEVGIGKTRLWLIYLAACAIAFDRNTVGINQTLAVKKQRGAAALPPTRADLYR